MKRLVAGLRSLFAEEMYTQCIVEILSPECNLLSMWVDTQLRAEINCNKTGMKIVRV